jgi:NTP pyrophosphatase (non-canonical NTP hydrolase)
MNAYPEKQQYTADDLAAIIAILRDPDCGCPWDKVQTHTSIRMNFLEEAYEAVDAIDLNDPELLCEELGDVMMQVVFHAQIEQEAGHFTFDEVCDGVCRKLINRHPHIFGGDESIKDWDSLKNKEKGRLTLADELESVPKALPALMCRQAAEACCPLRRADRVDSRSNHCCGCGGRDRTGQGPGGAGDGPAAVCRCGACTQCGHRPGAGPAEMQRCVYRGARRQPRKLRSEPSGTELSAAAFC